jgi:hypothetical protein
VDSVPATAETPSSATVAAAHARRRRDVFISSLPPRGRDETAASG